MWPVPKKLIKKSDYQNLFNSHPLARFLLDVTPEGTCHYANNNRAAETVFGFKAKDMIGHPITKLFATTMAQDIEKACKKCIRYKRPITTTTTPLYPGIVSQQSFILTPILNEIGDVYMIDMMATNNNHDIDQLQLERDNAIQFMTAIFDSSNLGILVTDKNRRIVRVNDAFLDIYHYQRKHLIGEDFTKILPAPSQDKAIDHFNTLVKGEGPQHNEWQVKCCKGKLVNDVMVTTARLDFNPKHPAFIHTFVNITEQKNIEESLRWAKEEADGASRAKSAFLANMSHELRTPLNAIIGFSEVICDETFGPLANDKYKEYLTDIHFSAQHLLEIINDVLDMSKIEAGKFILHEGQVDIHDLFESVKRITIERARVKNITFIIQSDEGMPPIFADKRVMRQMLLNLVANALKFSKEGDDITLSASLTVKGEAVISVKDTGRGIAPDNLTKVMEPFNQASDPSTNNGHNGTGLGLSLTQAMAKLHGGSVSIKSTLGKGTTVMITLPEERVLSSPDLLKEMAS